MIADTALGKIGMLICYDVAHPTSFSQYAGLIQLLVISSCPPKVNRMTIHFAGGPDVKIAEISSIAQMVQESGDDLFDGELRAQVKWLGVPMINAMPYGRFKSPVPKAKLSRMLSTAMNPKMWRLIKHADQTTISAGYNQHTMITNANGEILAKPQDGDSFTIAEVEIPTTPPLPKTEQPGMKLLPVSRWVSSLMSWIVISEYKSHNQI